VDFAAVVLTGQAVGRFVEHRDHQHGQPNEDGRFPIQSAHQAAGQLALIGPQDECSQHDAGCGEEKERASPKETDLRREPGEELVGVEQVFAPVEKALFGARSAERRTRSG
jgi:hypothetical protein